MISGQPRHAPPRAVRALVAGVGWVGGVLAESVSHAAGVGELRPRLESGFAPFSSAVEGSGEFERVISPLPATECHTLI